jgi:hypothetical protein
MIDKFELLKQYCNIKNLNDKFAIGKIDDDGNKYIEFLTGNSSYKVEYLGKKIEVDEIYQIGKATCNGVCKVGEPNDECCRRGLYSENKCAVYTLCNKIDLDEFKFDFTYKEICSLPQSLFENEPEFQGEPDYDPEPEKEDTNEEIEEITTEEIESLLQENIGETIKEDVIPEYQVVNELPIEQKKEELIKPVNKVAKTNKDKKNGKNKK